MIKDVTMIPDPTTKDDSVLYYDEESKLQSEITPDSLVEIARMVFLRLLDVQCPIVHEIKDDQGPTDPDGHGGEGLLS
jgi:hypothetical protein